MTGNYELFMLYVEKNRREKERAQKKIRELTGKQLIHRIKKIERRKEK